MRLDRDIMFDDKPKAFCEDDDLIARDVVLFYEFADDTFRLAIRVDVGGIEGVNTAVPGVLEDWDRLLFIDNPWLQVEKHRRYIGSSPLDVERK